MKHSLEKAVLEILLGLSTITGGVKIAGAELAELVEQTEKITETFKRAGGVFDPDVVRSQAEHEIKVRSYFQATGGGETVLDPVSIVRDKVQAVLTEPAYTQQLTPEQLSAFSALHQVLSQPSGAATGSAPAKAPLTFSPAPANEAKPPAKDLPPTD